MGLSWNFFTVKFLPWHRAHLGSTMTVGIWGLERRNVECFCLSINILSPALLSHNYWRYNYWSFHLSDSCYVWVSSVPASVRKQPWAGTVTNVGAATQWEWVSLQQQQVLGVSINIACYQVGLQIVKVFTDCSENEMSCEGLLGCGSWSEFNMKK